MSDDNPSLEEQRERIDNALLSAMDDLDRDYLRGLQIEMHACATACCSDPDASAEAVQRCVDRCQLPLTRARCFVQQELSEFENRLEGCMRQCRLCGNDSSSATDFHLERCSIDCVDRHVAQLPEMLRAMRATLEKGL